MSPRRLTPILLTAGLLVTAIAGAQAAAGAASSLTPRPPVALSTTGSTTQTTTVPVTTTTTSEPARLPHTGVDVGLEVVIAASMLGAGLLLRPRAPARREPRS
jgi:hypothetical protein